MVGGAAVSSVGSIVGVADGACTCRGGACVAVTGLVVATRTSVGIGVFVAGPGVAVTTMTNWVDEAEGPPRPGSGSPLRAKTPVASAPNTSVAEQAKPRIIP